MRALSLFLLLHPPKVLSDPSLAPSMGHPTFNNSSELSGNLHCYRNISLLWLFHQAAIAVTLCLTRGLRRGGK